MRVPAFQPFFTVMVKILSLMLEVWPSSFITLKDDILLGEEVNENEFDLLSWRFSFSLCSHDTLLLGKAPVPAQLVDLSSALLSLSTHQIPSVCLPHSFLNCGNEFYWLIFKM
jgi:hypothetical protein